MAYQRGASDDYEDGFDPENPVHFERLSRAVSYSRWKLQPFREARYELIKEYKGFRYGEDKGEQAGDKIPINLMELAVQVYTTLLVSHDPRFLVTTRQARERPLATKIKLALNNLAREIQLGTSIRSCVIDSMFGLGIAKIGLNLTGELNVNGFAHNHGQIYVDHVGVDDFVFDTGARVWEKICFAGHRYRVPFDWAKDQSHFDKRARDDLTADDPEELNEGGDERVSSLSFGRDFAPDDYKSQIELCEIWLPLEKKLVTFEAKGNYRRGGMPDRPLDVRPYYGPERGPYHLLFYNEVPDNIMPIAPMAILYDLHTLANTLFRKIARQALRMKRNPIYQKGSHEDAERIKDAMDGVAIGLDSPGSVKEMQSGGYDPATLAIVMQIMQLFSRLAGNLDAMGGLGSQADTLGQEQIINQNASQRIQEMQRRALEFTRGIGESIAWWFYTDPLLDARMNYKVPKTDIEIPMRLVAEEVIDANYLDFNFDIEPFSLQSRTPSQRLQVLQMLMQGFIGQLIPVWMQQGGAINADRLVRLAGEYGGVESEIDEIFVAGSRPAEPANGGGTSGSTERPLQSPNTTRTNVRVNQSAGPSPGGDQAMMQALLGAAGGNGARPAGGG